jgi:acyl-CoA synthetase (NDP forming)
MEETFQKMDAFFNPKSVAVVGATKKVDKAGHVIFKNFATNKEHASNATKASAKFQAKSN